MQSPAMDNTNIINKKVLFLIRMFPFRKF